MPIHTSNIQLTVNGKSLDAYLAEPPDAGPGILLLHAWWGLKPFFKQTCDRLAVLYAGRVVELGTTEDIFNDPQHPYTRGLMNAIPRPGSRGKPMAAIPGTVPSNPGDLTGCPFAPRCSFVFDRCLTEAPDLFQVSATHQAACYLVDRDHA